MTREEFSILAKAMNTMFPEMNLRKDPDAMSVWYAMMGDMDYAIASKALQVHVSTSPYPPRVVDFRKYENAVKTDFMNEQQAWSLVTKAIRNSNYAAQEEFDKLPPIAQKAVGSPVNLASWAQLPSNEVHTVVASQFMRSFRAETERAKTEAMTPDYLRLAEEETKRIEGDR